VSNSNKYSAKWALVPPYNRDSSDNALIRWPIFTKNENDGETVDEVVEAEMLLLARLPWFLYSPDELFSSIVNESPVESVPSRVEFLHVHHQNIIWCASSNWGHMIQQ